MAFNKLCPALVDPPWCDAPVQEWIDFRNELQASNLPGIQPFIDKANEQIARRRRRETATDAI